MKSICGHCEALNNATDRFCRSCGREFADAAVVATPDHESIAPIAAPGAPHIEASTPAVFDQEAAESGRPVGLLIGLGLALVALLVGGFVVLSGQDEGDRVANPVTPTLPEGDAPAATTGTTAIASTLPTTIAPSTTPPPTTVAPTTVAPTTAPPTTTPPTTAPPTTVPPTTAPPATAPPTTAAPNIWDTPVLPASPLPTSGPGTPLIESARLRSGVFAADALPFLLNAQRLVDAYAAGDWAQVRALDPTTTATDAELTTTFAALDRASLILLDAGVAGGNYEMVVAEVFYNGSENKTAVRCIQYVSNGTTGVVSRRGGFPITTLDGNVSPEAVRLDDPTFTAVSERCRFATLADALGA